MKPYVGLLGAITVMLLAACTPKPPECASPEAMKLANEIFIDGIRKQLHTAFAEGDPQITAETAPLLAEAAPFITSLKFVTNQVVSNGYNADTKKQSCKARFTMMNTTSYKLSESTLPLFDQIKSGIKEHHTDSEYSLQMTVDKSGQYLMEIQGAAEIVQTAIAWFPMHVGLKGAAVAQASGTTNPTAKALEDQLACTKSPEPGVAIRAMIKNGLLQDTDFGEDGVPVLKPTAPLTVYGKRVTFVAGWQIEANGSVREPFGRGPGTAPPHHIAVSFDAKPSDIPYKEHAINGVDGTLVGSHSSIEAGSLDNSAGGSTITCYGGY